MYAYALFAVLAITGMFVVRHLYQCIDFLVSETESIRARLRTRDEYYDNRFDFVDADIRAIVTPTPKKKEVKRAKAK